MTNNELVESLKYELETNKVSNAVFHVFALRQRARNDITLESLAIKMKSEGFNYPASELAHVLKFLANVGVGRLELDSRGRVKALRDIKIKLQSIGQAACGQVSRVDMNKQRHRFTTLPMKSMAHDIVMPSKPVQQVNQTPVQVTLEFNGKPMSFNFPKHFNERDIAEVISRFRGKAS